MINFYTRWISNEMPLYKTQSQTFSYFLAGIICICAGLALMIVAGHWRLIKWINLRRAKERRRRLNRIKSLNKRIKRLQTTLEEETEILEETVRERGRLSSG